MILVTDIDVAPALQAVLDRESQAEQESQIGAQPFESRIGAGPLLCKLRFLHTVVGEVIGDTIGDADADPARGFPATPEIKVPVGPHASRPLPVLAHRPAQAVEQPNGQNQLHVLPIAATDFEDQKTASSTSIMGISSEVSPTCRLRSRAW